VAVNARVVTRLGTQVEPTDRVEVDGSLVEAAAGKVYLALNKTPGTVATTSDPWGRPTVLDLVARPGRLFPVGRLDADSEGLLLLTNDGELANKLMHPRYGCEKEYRVLVRGRPTTEALDRLRAGVELAEASTAPALVELADTAPGGRHWVRVVLREGRKRQVRRMLGVVGLTVERLMRVRIGPQELGNLPLGKIRPLSRAEVAALKAVAGIES
jgi:23S rRNA pseudouridine2605 synthase